MKKPIAEKKQLNEYTANVDIQIFAQDSVDVIARLPKIIKNKYWVGNITAMDRVFKRSVC